MEHLSLFDASLRPAVSVEPSRRPAPRSRPQPGAARAPQRAGRRPALLAVDGNSLAHRAFHAYGAGGIGDVSGRDRGAVYGFFALLAGICDVAGGAGLVVGFDCPVRSRRRERWPAYKGQRSDHDPAVAALLDVAAAALDDLGVQVVRPEGWEADDVLGSAAAAAEAAGWRCLVATSDRDAFALVSAHTTVLRLRNGIANAELVDAHRLRREVGVLPGQYVEYAALRGDVSDNLPGIPGIGPARAAALLRTYATVADAAADPLGCRSVLGRRAGQALLDDLAAGAGSVFRRNLALMTVRRDLTIDVASCRPSCPPHVLEERLRGWGLQALQGRLTLAVGLRPEPPPPPVASAEAGRPGVP